MLAHLSGSSRVLHWASDPDGLMPRFGRLSSSRNSCERRRKETETSQFDRVFAHRFHAVCKTWTLVVWAQVIAWEVVPRWSEDMANTLLVLYCWVLARFLKSQMFMFRTVVSPPSQQHRNPWGRAVCFHVEFWKKGLNAFVELCVFAGGKDSHSFAH